MTRLSSALASRTTVAVSVLVTVLAACSDATTSPGAVRPGAAPSGNVLSIGDLRRAHPQTPCTAPQYHQFDFWLGTSSVTADGELNGTNDVTSELDGCLVAEHWNDVGEVKGWSLNAFDRSTGQWYQHWVDEFGVNLILAGGLTNGSMVLVGSRPRLAGGVLFDRVSYTPLAGGQMRQLWEQSLDGGVTYPSVAFDGLYSFQPVTPAPAPGTASCAGAAYHTADFLIGEWRVEAANGLALGRSSITAELSTCLLLEQFSTAKGYRAKAFLSYQRASAKWLRTYIDTEANRIFVSGSAANNELVMTGSVPTENGDRVTTRVTWTKVAAGGLEQVWEVSRDGGATWTFDQKLVYVPAW
jgi:hypothetical protein